MKLRSLGLVFSIFLSLGLLSFACTSGDTVNGGTGTGGTTGTGNRGGSTGSGNTGGFISSGNTGGSISSGNTGGNATGSGNTGGNTTGSGNTGGNTTGSGNTGGNTTGSAGTTGAAATNGSGTCISGTATTPTMALITDFSDAVPDASNPGDFKFGTTAGELGGTSLFSSSTVGTLTLTGGALTFAATVAAPSAANMYPYSGFVVYTNGPSCINASAYSGVSFTISGLMGTCSVVFSFGDSDHTTPASDPMRGACTATSCYASQFAVTASTTSVAFGATPDTPGQPVATVDQAKFTGVQWQFKPATGSTAGCTGSMTVDNIKFTQ
jgi:hypothetical protein